MMLHNTFFGFDVTTAVHACGEGAAKAALKLSTFATQYRNLIASQHIAYESSFISSCFYLRSLSFSTFFFAVLRAHHAFFVLANGKRSVPILLRHEVWVPAHF